MKLKAVKNDFLNVFDALPNGPIKTSTKEIIASLKHDRIVGEHVRKKQIPKYYTTRHNIPILYRVALPNRWRLTYSIMELR